MTFEKYLVAAEAAGIVDFRVRIVRSPSGDLDFYIHPSDKNGETGDFTVLGDSVRAIPGGHGAGSRQPSGDRVKNLEENLETAIGFLECYASDPNPMLSAFLDQARALLARQP